MNTTSTKTKLLGLLGTPVLHSLSPRLHSFLAEKFSADISYLAFDVKNEDLKSVLDGAKKMGALGFNVTAPHKIEIMKYVDKIDKSAQLIGTVNTVVQKDGLWYATNTDGDGFVDSLEFEGVDLSGKKVLMLGAGGAARAISFKLAEKGIKSLDISSKTEANVLSIADVLSKHTNVKPLVGFDKNKEYDILINTTPVGMHQTENKTPFKNVEFLNSTQTVCDIIYNPKKTVFLNDAQKKGAKIINGLSMFVMQGIYSFEIFTGINIHNKKQLYYEALQLFDEFNISFNQR